MTPDWLPSQLVLNGHKVADDYSALYSVYRRDFIDGTKIIVDGDIVVVNEFLDPATDKLYTHGFTHLVTTGKDSRAIDYDRAAKLPWVRAILENYLAPEVTTFWVNQPKGSTLYFWLTDNDFVVVLRRLKSKKERVIGNKIIVTSFHVHHNGRRKLQRLYGRSTKQL